MWQLNDCWPVTSWAAIDGDERPKPLYFALEDAFAPRVVTIQPHGDGLRAVLGNDTDDPWAGEVVLSRRRFDGAVLTNARMPVVVTARQTLSVDVPRAVAVTDHPAGELVVAEALGTRGCGSRPSPATAIWLRRRPPSRWHRWRRVELTVIAEGCCAT